MTTVLAGAASVDITPPLLARLAELDTIVAVKESSGDLTRISQIRRLTKGRMTVFAGGSGSSRRTISFTWSFVL